MGKRKQETCFSCNELIEGASEEVDGKVLHPECMCQACALPLPPKGASGGMVVQDDGGHRWHTSCVCAGCKTEFTGEKIQGFGKRYHPDCWACQRCHKSLLRYRNDIHEVKHKPACNDCVETNPDLYRAVQKAKERKKNKGRPPSHPRKGGPVPAVAKRAGKASGTQSGSASPRGPAKSVSQRSVGSNSGSRAGSKPGSKSGSARQSPRGRARKKTVTRTRTNTKKGRKPGSGSGRSTPSGTNPRSKSGTSTPVTSKSGTATPTGGAAQNAGEDMKASLDDEAQESADGDVGSAQTSPGTSQQATPSQSTRTTTQKKKRKKKRPAKDADANGASASVSPDDVDVQDKSAAAVSDEAAAEDGKKPGGCCSVM